MSKAGLSKSGLMNKTRLAFHSFYRDMPILNEVVSLRLTAMRECIGVPEGDFILSRFLTALRYCVLSRFLTALVSRK